MFLVALVLFLTGLALIHPPIPLASTAAFRLLSGIPIRLLAGIPLLTRVVARLSGIVLLSAALPTLILLTHWKPPGLEWPDKKVANEIPYAGIARLSTT